MPPFAHALMRVLKVTIVGLRDLQEPAGQLSAFKGVRRSTIHMQQTLPITIAKPKGDET